MDSDLPAVESVIEGADDDTKKLQRRAVARNKLAIACFTMSFKTTALMNCISDAKTNNYPDGLAHLIVKGLLERYRPTGRISKLEALSELEHITMENNDEPDDLFNKIASVKQQYRNSGIDDTIYMNYAINKVPSMYRAEIAQEMVTKGNNMTMSDMQTFMNT